MPELPAVPPPFVVLPEGEAPGVLADELVEPLEPGKVPQLFAVPFGVVGGAPPGVAVELPGAPGVTVFGVVEPGVVVFGVVVLGVVVLGAAVLGVAGAVGVVLGVVCVAPGVDGVVLCGVPLSGVAVPVDGVAVGDVCVPAGEVAAPGVELCPAVPVPPVGAVPPAGALCATTQLPQHKITDSNVSFVIDISLPPRTWSRLAIFPVEKFFFHLEPVSGACSLRAIRVKP